MSDKKLKTERFHMVLTTEELEMLDEWRFVNRIGSRSEAMRKLIKIGIEAKPHLD